MPKDSLIIWHESAHERFGEQLFFFLLALKPYAATAFASDLKSITEKFGIKSFCSYELLGEFDHLLRLWLPAGQSHVFIEEAKSKIRNLKEILVFHSQRIVEDWRFPQPPDPKTVKSLTDA